MTMSLEDNMWNVNMIPATYFKMIQEKVICTCNFLIISKLFKNVFYWAWKEIYICIYPIKNETSAS